MNRLTESDAGCFVEIRTLRKYFPLRKDLFARTTEYVKAVDGVSFSIDRGETVGLVGESGSGKTTIGKCMLRLLDPSEGTVCFEGVDILKLKGRHLRRLRRTVQMVFQDPYSSLNPRMSVEAILAEGLTLHKLAGGSEVRQRVTDLLEMVRLSPRDRSKYPHEFSSGQRQRIGIARALSVNPSCIIADEPVSSLDVSIQAQLLNLFIDIQKQYGIAYLFISHDLSVVRYMSHRVAVLYLGRIVEMAPAPTLFSSPLHPYTRMLMAASPRVNPGKRASRFVSGGESFASAGPVTGCPFFPRCVRRQSGCRDTDPELRDVGDGHCVRCLHVES